MAFHILGVNNNFPDFLNRQLTIMKDQYGFSSLSYIMNAQGEDSLPSKPKNPEFLF